MSNGFGRGRRKNYFHGQKLLNIILKNIMIRKTVF